MYWLSVFSSGKDIAEQHGHYFEVGFEGRCRQTFVPVHKNHFRLTLSVDGVSLTLRYRYQGC